MPIRADTRSIADYAPPSCSNLRLYGNQLPASWALADLKLLTDCGQHFSATKTLADESYAKKAELHANTKMPPSQLEGAAVMQMAGPVAEWRSRFRGVVVQHHEHGGKGP
ncbi:unnamed protein product [Nippostrongylus brasiliensis]|uniref:SCP domain-containing protein n=1 Tax=Nippostrongylus brasiliensis TaxID=27835 RepID=A0A0N4XMT0_NIPBR|nr:unnamed protein product [Nippostrongylus brasiliensis]